MTGDYAPYSYLTPTNEIIGADVKMAEDLAAYLGVDLVIIRTEWRKLSRDLLARKFDIAMGGISITPYRERIGLFTEKLIEDGKRPIVRCEDRYKYTTIESINKPEVRVIVNPGGTNNEFTQENFCNASVRVFPDNRLIFREIAEKRADVMVTDGVEVELQARQNEELCAAQVKQPFNCFIKAYWMRKDEEWRDIVNDWLKIAKVYVWPSALNTSLSFNYLY
ncbi:amino acid ABC transporter-like protein [Dinothrombium tinctorium]|uniref:Amino acid ABC transporter-like protein n=1 Tax=Dinothrombium tinctorium TaxID=1965070 RepID=A0A3S3SAD9_9ACAR|nr:amino acid ABC transporter-like protein [Dinothrombium tinctorium]RWS12691.1 amino acid ABC transporter-like protein [Dinothrombium tinctorium]RWS13243.1 amino acid ABC transporter-like protein [Dinothrombium tinctorium]